MPEEQWEPTQKDLNWVLSLIARINDGGYWMVPDGLGVMRVRHSRRVATVMSGNLEHETIKRVIKVLEHLNWVVDQRPAKLGDKIEEADSLVEELATQAEGLVVQPRRTKHEKG